MSNIDIYQNDLSEADQAFALQLQREAEAAPPADKGLAIHFATIQTLRAKGYSYRDLAEWLNKRGLKVNHVDVWRAHRNGMRKEELFAALEHDEEWTEFVDKKVEGNRTSYTEKESKRSAKQPRKVAKGRSSESLKP